MANNPLTAVRKHKLAVRSQKRLKFRLDCLRYQPARASSQNFGERIDDFVFLAVGNNFMFCQGVTLLLEVRAGLVTNPVTPPSSHRHPVSGIALCSLIRFSI